MPPGFPLLAKQPDDLGQRVSIASFSFVVLP
jgi:hypothetical protein